jgi:ABC-type transporter MlaC component
MLRIALILCLLGGIAAAQPTSPGTTVVQNANNKMLKLLAANASSAQIAAAVKDFLDVRRLGELAMGQHWKTLSTKEQTDFLDTLEKLVQGQYVRTSNAQVNVTIKYLGESKLPNGNIYVKTQYTAPRNGRPTKVDVDYELETQGTTLRAVDMVMDGSSTVTSFNGQFNSLMKQGGFKHLYGKMTTKLAQTTPTTPTKP